MKPLDWFVLAIAAIALCVAPFAARAADPEVETSVYSAHVAIGEPITLQIRLRGAAAQSKPDIWPLERDFEVLDVHTTQRTSIVNGARDESLDYTVALAPKREGALVIPSLRVGDRATDPIPVSVSERGADVAEREATSEPVAPAEPVLVETHVDRHDPYEQERVVLRIDLYVAGEVLEGALSAPEIPGAVIEQIGEDRQIEKTIGDKRYQGIERVYTIVPEASGELAMPAIRFEGRVRVPRPRTQRRLGGAFNHSLLEDFFANGPRASELLENFFGTQTRQITASSQPVTLNVRPRPEGVAGSWWLPARAVTLTERWDPTRPSVRVGEPITRRIELRADGASPAQLPALPDDDVAGVKRYAEAPKVTETVRGTVRVDETTLIPTQAGAVTLPPIEVSWWDTKADALRTATLPARSIEVAPALGGDAPASAGVAPAAAPAADAAETAPANVPALGAFAERLDLRAIAALAVVAAIALFSLGVFAARARQRRATRAESAEPAAPLSPTRRLLERALRRGCARNDAVVAETALRALRLLLGADAAIFRDPALAAEIARLQAVRYSTQQQAWSGAAFWKAWRRARKVRRPASSSAGLPPLYPTP
jgi:hypothetical protein